MIPACDWLKYEVTSQTQAVQSTAVETVAWRRLSAAERGAARIRAVRETLESSEGACAAAFIPISHNADAAPAPADYANVDAAAAAAAQTRIADTHRVTSKLGFGGRQPACLRRIANRRVD